MLAKLKKLMFNPKFILGTHVVIGICAASFLAFNYFFGFGILENAHLSYLRYKMKDTVLVHNFSGAGGTGWLTKLDNGRTVVITNGHVCNLAVNGQIVVNFKQQDYVVSVIKKYSKHDLCAIEAPSDSVGGYEIAKSFENGETVYTLGHPYLEPNTITKGELSGPVNTRILVGMDVAPADCSGEGFQNLPSSVVDPLLELFGIKNVCIRTLPSQASSVSILPGNSGSCTVNIYGHVVAVAFAANEAGTRSYHVPLKYLKAFLKELSE